MKTSTHRNVCILFLLFVLGTTPAWAQRSERPLVDGVTVGGGLAFYQGDLDTNPGNNYLKFIGSSRASLFARADRRYGRYTVGLELNYNRLAGERKFAGRPTFSFTNNAVGLDAVGSIDLGVARPGLLRIFAGAGPMLLVSPEFEGFQEGDFSSNEEFRDDGTNVQASFILGLNVQDAVRLGAKVFSNNFVDGFEGLNSSADFLLFVNISYRFDLTN